MARAGLKTYLGVGPSVNAEEILKLSYAREYKRSEADRPFVLLNYKVGGTVFSKKGNVSGNEERLRVVPRNEPKEALTVDGVDIPLSGKVPLPTIYLGMTRVIPTGEAEPDAVDAKQISMHADDLRLYQEFTDAVIHPGPIDEDGTVTAQRIKGTRKNALYSNYSDYDPTTVSLGQDSLSAIATAFASFSKFRREMGNSYRGGVLVIDELDAGFHPRAQKDLLDEIKSKARDLRIQVIATTHSLTMLEYMHKEIYNTKLAGAPLDQVVYLKGGNPIEVLDVKNFHAISADMHMELVLPEVAKAENVKVYVEDDEAALFLRAILTTERKKQIREATAHNLDVIPVHVGCANLVGLLKADDYFKTVVIAVDADAKAGNSPNVVRLPLDPLNTKKQSPEVILREMCIKMIAPASAGAYPQTKKLIRSVNADESYIQKNIISRQKGEDPNAKPVEADREVAKAWFKRRLQHIKSMKLIEGWVADNEAGVKEFMENLTRAVRSVTASPAILDKKTGKRAVIPLNANLAANDAVPAAQA